VREIARIALERGTGARGLRSVVEKVMEGGLFEVEAGVRYVIADKTVGGGEAFRQSMNQARTPLNARFRWRQKMNQRESSPPNHDNVDRA
jgi:ATP-dependent protease Clp ATPase subunit